MTVLKMQTKEYGGREEGRFSTIPARYLTVSDNVEATLRSVFWNRSSHPPFPYVPGEKILETRIRVGNVIIDASEISDDLDRIGTSTNLALKQIVEALESLELEKD